VDVQVHPLAVTDGFAAIRAVDPEEGGVHSARQLDLFSGGKEVAVSRDLSLVWWCVGLADEELEATGSRGHDLATGGADSGGGSRGRGDPDPRASNIAWGRAGTLGEDADLEARHIGGAAVGEKDLVETGPEDLFAIEADADTGMGQRLKGAVFDGVEESVEVYRDASAELADASSGI